MEAQRVKRRYMRSDYRSPRVVKLLKVTLSRLKKTITTLTVVEVFSMKDEQKALEYFIETRKTGLFIEIAETRLRELTRIINRLNY